MGATSCVIERVDVAMPVVLTPLKPPVYHEEQMFL